MSIEVEFSLTSDLSDQLIKLQHQYPNREITMYFCRREHEDEVYKIVAYVEDAKKERPYIISGPGKL